MSRGIAAWIASISIPLLLPFVVARGAKRRVLVGLVSLVLIVVVRMGVGLLSLQEDHRVPEKLIKLLLNYDPIGHELNSLDVRASIAPHHLLDDLHDVYNDMLQSVDVSEDKLLISESEYDSAIDSLMEANDALLEFIKVSRDRIAGAKNTVRFETTKQVLYFYRERDNLVEELVNTVFPKRLVSEDQFWDLTVSLEESFEIFDRLIATQNALTELYYRSLIVRFRLQKYMLVTFPTPIRPPHDPG